MWPERLALLGVLALALAHPGTLLAQFPAELLGRVVDGESRGPIASARIEVPGVSGVVLADADGRFVVRGLAPGQRELRVSAIGYRIERVAVEVTNGRSTAVEIALTRAAVELAELQVTEAARGVSPSVTVLERAQIEGAHVRDLGDLMLETPGLTLTRRGGPSSPATLSIRGSTANQVLVLVDGIPLNDAVTGEADLSTVPTSLIERVTILRGAQSAQYGPRALAGAVVVETRTPAATEATMTLGTGAWGERSAHGSLGWRTGSGTAMTALLGASYARTNGDFRFAVPEIRGGGESARANGDSEQIDILARSGLERRGWSIRGRVETHNLKRGMPGSIVQPSLTARQRQTATGAVVQLGHEGKRWEHRLDLNFQRQASGYRDPAPPFGPAYDDSVWARSFGAALASSVRLDKMTFAGGGEFRQLAVRSSMLDSPPGEQRLAGAWIQTRTNGRWSGRQWELVGGLRVDRSSLLDQTFLSPKVGATLSAGRAALHLSWGQAFSPPSLGDQFFHEGILARANADLGPERVRGEIEAGASVINVPIGGLVLDASVTAFRADVDGMILWFPDHRFVWSPDNYDVRRTGVELATTARLPSRSLELVGTISHVAVQYTGAVLTGQVAYRPQITATGALRGTVRGLEAALRYRHTGSRRTVPGSGLNTLPAFGLLDLDLTRPITIGRWTTDVTLAVDNLLNRDAAMLVDYPFPGRSWRLGVHATHLWRIR